MGLEDYGVILRPTGAELPVGAVRRTLEELHFHKDRPTCDYGAARLATPPEDETAFTLEDDAQIIEALVRHRVIPAAIAITRTETEIRLGKALRHLKRLWRQFSERMELEVHGGPVVDYVSVRFAVCQPDTATKRFLEVVQTLTERHRMSILQGDVEYAPERFEEFRAQTEEAVWQQKRAWQNIFGGDLEEQKMRVEEAWTYFLRKHSDLLAPAPAAPGTYRQEEDEQNLRLFGQE